MFVAVVHCQVPAERDGDFRAWFSWSNEELRDAHGLASRRLLVGADRSYLGLVEHDSAETFTAMHASPAAQVVQRRLQLVLDNGPTAEMYEVVAVANLDTAQTASCCGGHEVSAPAETGGCCGGHEALAPAVGASSVDRRH